MIMLDDMRSHQMVDLVENVSMFSILFSKICV